MQGMVPDPWTHGARSHPAGLSKAPTQKEEHIPASQCPIQRLQTRCAKTVVHLPSWPKLALACQTQCGDRDCDSRLPDQTNEHTSVEILHTRFTSVVTQVLEMMKYQIGCPVHQSGDKGYSGDG